MAAHPWLDLVVADPDRQIEDLINGYADLRPLSSSDVVESIGTLLASCPDPERARGAIDRGLATWLDRFLATNPTDAGEPRKRERANRALVDVFQILGGQGLPASAALLRKKYIVWHARVNRLSVENGPDILGEFYRALAQTQRVVARQTRNDPFGLEPLWLNLCQRAGTSMPEHYLSIALLGLRTLPERKAVPSERPWMYGLALWAVARAPSSDAFRQQWNLYKAMYPRPPGYWVTAVQEVLADPKLASMRDDLKRVWGGSAARAERVRVTRGKAIAYPPLEDVKQLVNRADEPIANLRSEITRLMEVRRNYARATGDGDAFARSACFIGQRLLRFAQGRERVERGMVAVALAREALEWRGNDAFVWSMWRDGLFACGRAEDAELVGWETVRRFPDMPQQRSQLSGLLASMGKQSSANVLLRETIERFNNVVAMNQLAAIIRYSDPSEAEHLLRRALHVGDDPYTRTQLAEILIHNGENNEAEELLRSMIHDPVAKALLAKIVVAKDPQEAEELLRDAMYYADDVHPGIQLINLLVGQHRLEDAIEVATYLIKRFSYVDRLGAALKALRALQERAQAGATAQDLQLGLFHLESTPEPAAPQTVASTDAIAKGEPSKPGVASSDPDDSFELLALLGGRLRRWVTIFGSEGSSWDAPRGDAALELRDVVEQIAAISPDTVLCDLANALLGLRQNVWSFYGALVVALREGDVTLLDGLEARSRDEQRILDAVRALSGDSDASVSLATWIHAEARFESRQAASLRGVLQRYGLSKITQVSNLLARDAAANDNLRRDLLEIALVASDLEVAA
jgi:tetratricopeptide (TPR) repeat protein